MKEKLSLLTELIKISRADGEVRADEYEFLLLVAKQLNVEKAEFDKLYSDYVDFTPPPLEFERILQFHRLVMLANIDMHLDSKEKELLRKAGLKLGLNPVAVDNLLREMRKSETRMISPERLIEIFQVYHN